MNVNNFGPRNLAGDMKKAIDNAKKIDEGKALGEAQQANTNNKPEGETENKTVIVTWGDPTGEGDGLRPTSTYYDGIDNGVVINLFEDGTLMHLQFDEDEHNSLRDYFNDTYGNNG